ncbi:helix-turn-helix domain-containing protein [Lactobacillus johnsonii]|uniref:helix-turn-helix domain-containing protein n=1 Tax=Lactobacillus johnsonii TaxID=33959 RepID=UPI00254CD7F6|nr:helix-turn-helix domain-containing protein [Lactobacillus johnsonii]
MLSKISILLTNHHLTLKDISQSNSLMEKDLEKALNENPDNWSSAILSALSSSLNMRPGDLLELLDPVYSLKINDTNQMIQGIYIEDPEMYEQIRFVVESEHLEGWQPDEEDILMLLDEAINPSKEIKSEIDRIWGEENE